MVCGGRGEPAGSLRETRRGGVEGHGGGLAISLRFLCLLPDRAIPGNLVVTVAAYTRTIERLETELAGKFYIEVKKSGEWVSFSSQTYATLDAAAHQSLLIIPEVRKNCDGIRIKHLHSNPNAVKLIYDIVFEKMFNTGHSKRDSNNTSFLQWLVERWAYIAGMVAGIGAALAFFIFIYSKPSAILAVHDTIQTSSIQTQGVKPSLSKANPEADSSKEDNTWNNHPISGLGDKGAPSDTQAVDRIIRQYETHQSIVDQARDVASIISALDYMRCIPRDDFKANLVSSYLAYVSRIGATYTDKNMSRVIVGTELGTTNHVIGGKEKDLIDVGCGGLMAMSDNFSKWFSQR